MYTQEKESKIKQIFNIIKEKLKYVIIPPPPGNNNNDLNKGTLKEPLLK